MKKMILSGIFCVITIIFAQISIPIPFSIVPFSLSICAVFISGIFLGPKYAFLSQCTYIILGIIGLPVFANFKSGIPTILGPTGGYIFSYPIIALIVALFIKKLKLKNLIFNYTIAMIPALIICYILGSIWYAIYTGVSIIQSITVTVVPFIIIDFTKIILTSFFALYLNKLFVKKRYPV